MIYKIISIKNGIEAIFKLGTIVLEINLIVVSEKITIVKPIKKVEIFNLL